MKQLGSTEPSPDEHASRKGCAERLGGRRPGRCANQLQPPGEEPKSWRQRRFSGLELTLAPALDALPAGKPPPCGRA